MDRRLAAILAADVAGFSALVGRDEDATLRTLKGHLAALEPVVGMNRGRIVKSTGDGFLAEFPSIVNAVTSAVAMQRRMAERNAAQPAGARMQFRMAVHVGDVVIDGDDILGDGVNVAARLQELAEPGGIAVSARAHEDVADKVDLGFRDMGERALKNIARPVRVFAVATDAAAPRPAPAPARPDKPSVAVLAFDNLSSDLEQDYFADGITEDIITALSRVPWLFVIARNSSFSFKGLAVDVRRIGRDLGVRYVLEGSVRKAGDRLRVTGQLIDAGTGAHLWADRFDGQVRDVFALQDQIAEAVVGAIAPQIRQSEIERATRKRPESLDAYDHFLRAQAAINHFRFRQADASLAEAIALAPDYAQAKALRAWMRTIMWHPDNVVTDEGVAFALSTAEEVLAAPEADIEARGFAGYVIAFYGDEFERGLGFVTRAIEDCPNCNSAWGSSCLLNGMRGRSAVALAHGEEALRLNPRDPMAYRVHLGLVFAHFARRDFEAVLEGVERVRPYVAMVRGFQLFEIAANVNLGRMERARALCETLLAQDPETSVSQVRASRSRVRAFVPGLYDPLYPALIAAGVPE